MKTKKFRGLAAAGSTALAAMLLLTGCSGSTAPAAAPSNASMDGVESTAPSLDGAYIGLDEPDIYAAIDGDRVQLYELDSSRKKSMQTREDHYAFIERLLDGEVNIDEEVHGGSTIGTIQKINGINRVKWPTDARSEKFAQNLDTVRIDGEEYVPVMSDLAKASINEAHEDINRIRDNYRKESKG